MHTTWIARLTTLVLAFSLGGTALAEERTAKNSIFAEGMGAGLAYSINYERMVVDDVGVRVGLSYMSYGASAGGASSSTTYMTFPIMANWIGLHSGKHALELGGGATLVYASGEAEALGSSASGSGMVPYGAVQAGYEMQPLDGGFNFRVGFTGLIGTGLGFDVKDPDAIGFLPWFHLSLGGTF